MKNIFLFVFLFTAVPSYSQLSVRSTPYIKGQIILRKGDTLKGQVMLNNSSFDLKFKDSIKQKRGIKIKYKEVEKIITNQNSSLREFYYKYTDQNKFLKFVELVYLDKISIYISTSDNLDLFYSDIDRTNVSDELNDMRRENQLFVNNRMPLNSFSRFNFYINIEIGSTKYFLEKEDASKLIYVGEKGNPFTKNFKKNAKKYFEDCPKLVNKIAEKEFKITDLEEIITFYKTQQCN